MLSFVQEGLPVRVVFGAGRRRSLRDEVVRLGIQRALLITTPSKRWPWPRSSAGRQRCSTGW